MVLVCENHTAWFNDSVPTTRYLEWTDTLYLIIVTLATIGYAAG